MHAMVCRKYPAGRIPFQTYRHILKGNNINIQWVRSGFGLDPWENVMGYCEHGNMPRGS